MNFGQMVNKALNSTYSGWFKAFNDHIEKNKLNAILRISRDS